MAVVSIPWNPSPRDLRVFAVLQGLFWALMAFILSHHHAAHGAAVVLGSVTTLAGVFGLIWPATIRWYYVAWMIAVFPLGWLVSHCVLAIAYFGVVTPIGWWLRWRGYDPLQLRRDPAATTYWQRRPEPPDFARYFRQF